MPMIVTNFVNDFSVDYRMLRIEVTNSTFSTAATTNTIDVYTLPPGQVFLDAWMQIDTVFSGGAITAYTLSVGRVGDVDSAMLAQDAFTAPACFTSETTKGVDLTNPGRTNLCSVTASAKLQMTAVSTTANLNAATGGKAYLYLLVAQFPIPNPPL